MSDMVICELKEYGVVYDAEYPYRDQSSLNNIELKLKHIGYWNFWILHTKKSLIEHSTICMIPEYI